MSLASTMRAGDPTRPSALTEFTQRCLALTPGSPE